MNSEEVVNSIGHRWKNMNWGSAWARLVFIPLGLALIAFAIWLATFIWDTWVVRNGDFSVFAALVIVVQYVVLAVVALTGVRFVLRCITGRYL